MRERRESEAPVGLTGAASVGATLVCCLLARRPGASSVFLAAKSDELQVSEVPLSLKVGSCRGKKG